MGTADLGRGDSDVERLRRLLAGLPLPQFDGGRLVLAVDVSPWPRPDGPRSAQRSFCHVYGWAKDDAQVIPGWPYSLVAALEPGATSWTAVLDVVRLGPADDATAVTAAAQLCDVVQHLVLAGQWRAGDVDLTIVADAGYHLPRLAWVLRDLPVEVVGRLRSDRVLRRLAHSHTQNPWARRSYEGPAQTHAWKVGQAEPSDIS